MRPMLTPDNSRWLRLLTTWHLTRCYVATLIRMSGKRIPLYGAYEIRERLAGGTLSRQRIYAITSHRNFPEPVWELQQGNVWLQSDVEAWIKQYRPQDAR